METKEPDHNTPQEVVAQDTTAAGEGPLPKDTGDVQQGDASNPQGQKAMEASSPLLDSSAKPSEPTHEKEPESPPQPTPKQSKAAKKPGKKIMVVAVVLILLVGGFAGVNFYAQSIIDDTDVELTAIKVTGSGTDHLDVEMSVMVDNPSSRSGSFQDLDLDVLYKGKTMGTIEVPSQELESGKNDLVITSKLISSSKEAFDSFVSDLLAQDEVEVDVEGKIYIGKALHTYNRLEKTITIPGLATLAIEVINITVEEMDGTGIILAVEAEIDNPGKLEMGLGETSFDLFHNQSWLASFSFPGDTLTAGSNALSTNLTIPTSREERYNALAADIVAGRSPEFLIKGNATDDLLLSRLLTNFQHQYVMNASSPVSASVTEMSLFSRSKDTVVFEITAELVNPSPVSLDLAEFEFKALYDGVAIGAIEFGDVALLATGTQTHVLKLEISGFTTEAAELFGSYLDGEDVELTVAGSHAFPGSEELEFILPVLLSGEGSLSVAMDAFQVVDSDGTSIQTELSLTIQNPLPFSADDMDDLSLELMNGAESVGEITLASFPLPKGSSELDSSAVLVPASEEAMRSLTHGIFRGEVSELVLKGSSAGTDLLSRLLSGLELGVPLGSQKVTLVMNTMAVLSEEDDELAVEVGFDIINPTVLGLASLNFTGEVHYKDALMGSAVLGSVNMSQGITNHHKLLTLGSLDRDTASAFVDDYLDGEEVEFVLMGSLSSGEDAGSFFELELTMTELVQGIEVNIQEITLNEAAEDSLNLTVDFQIENPTVLTGRIEGAFFEAYYDDMLMANLSLADIYLLAGTNNYTSDFVVAPGSSDGLRELVGKLLDGEDVLFTLKGGTEAGSASVVSSFMDGIELPAWIRGAGEMAISLESLSLLDVEEDALKLALELELDNPSSIAGIVSDLSFAIYYNDSFIDDAFFPEVELSQGINPLELETWVHDQGNDVLSEMVEELLAGRNVVLTVNGSSQEASLISRVLEDVEFEVYLNTTGPLTITLDDIYINAVWDEGMNLSLALEVDNPTPIQGMLSDLAFSVYYNDSYISDALLRDVRFAQGTDQFNLTTEFTPDELGPLQEMMKLLMDGENVSLVARGSEGNSSSFVSRILSDIDFTLDLETTGPMSISLEDIYIEEIGENEARLSLLVGGENPTSVHGVLSDLSFDVFYRDEFLARADIEKVGFSKGAFSEWLPATIYPANHSALGDMIGKLINGTNISLELKGNTDHSSSFLSTILAGLSLELNLTTTGKLDLSFQDLYINEVGEDFMNLSVLLDIDNPTSLKGILSDLSFDIFDGDTYLGYATIEEVSLPQGQQLLNLTTLLHPHETGPVTEMVRKLVSGTNVTLKAKGSSGNSSSFLDHILKELSFEIPLNTTGSVEIELSQITVEHVGEDFIDIAILVEVTNPTDIQGLLTDLSFDVYYNDTFLEKGDLSHLGLRKGVNIINYTTRVQPDDPDLLVEMTELLFDGEDIKLNVTGSQANSSAFLPAIMDDLKFETTVRSSGELTIQMEELMLLESYKDRLVLGVEFTLDNPTDIKVNLDTLYFDVMDGDEDVGDVVLESFTLVPGENEPVARMTLEGDEDTLSRIVSDHINGVDQDFRIKAADNLSGTLIGDIVANLDQSVTLPGITDPLITGVKVTYLSVTISPAGIEVHVQVTISNPTTFTIEISKLDYDIHYDDNDVSRFLFTSYPAKYNIYLDTVNEELSPRLKLEAGSSTNKESTIRSSSIEHAVRLNDEYMEDDDLVAHVYGDMVFHMGDFQLETDFTVTDIRVPRG